MTETTRSPKSLCTFTGSFLMSKPLCLVLLTATLLTLGLEGIAGAEERRSAADTYRAAIRLEYLALKAAKEEENRQRMSVYRGTLDVQKEAQMQQIQSLYSQAYAGRQQMSLQQTELGYAAAMHAAANRPVSSTEILNPRTEIMQGAINQKITTHQENSLLNQFRRR